MRCSVCNIKMQRGTSVHREGVRVHRKCDLQYRMFFKLWCNGHCANFYCYYRAICLKAIQPDM